MARPATLGVAASADPELVDWVDQHVTFPSSMVDRITPATTEDDRAWLAERYGLDDRRPVMAEPFRQWVVEDAFAAGRPRLEGLDVILTDDAVPYQLFKLRMLNAAHSCLAYLACLVGFEQVHEAIAEPRLATFVQRFLDREAGPVVPDARGIDRREYQTTLLARIANPTTGDQLQRLCTDGTAKIPKFILPTLRAQLAADGPVGLSSLVLAGWCAYLEGYDESGAPLEPAPTPLLEEAQALARAARDDPAAFLALRPVFGDDLPRNPRLVDSFTTALQRLRTDGVYAAIERAVAEAR
jgi:mannitol 2-dehydrogenase